MKKTNKQVNKQTQKGAIAIIMVFMVIVVISGMLVTVLTMSSATVNDGTQKNFQSQANYLAETAIERVTYQLRKIDPTSCDSIPWGDSQTLGSGTFEIVKAVNGAAAGECDVEVKGVINGMVSYLTTTVSLTISSSFFDEFLVANIGNWVDKVLGAQNRIAIEWNLNNDDAGGSLGGSMGIVVVSKPQPPKPVSGSVRQVLPTPVNANVTVNFDLLTTIEVASAVPKEVSLWLYNANNDQMVIWDSVDYPGVVDNLGTWSNQGAVDVVVPGGSSYTDIMVKYTLEAPAKNKTSTILIDDLSLTW